MRLIPRNLKQFGNSTFWAEKFRERYMRNLPFRELDRIVGNTSTDIPILTITGHYDGDQGGAMQYYRDHMKYGSEAARARHYLIIGPWMCRIPISRSTSTRSCPMAVAW
ncbi:MAG TPA: hypothetical protein VKR61_13740 [Bryobacteraceae bacterium]|nr:hypothetical protein [Bryobacteraceae bacterium]